MPGPSTDLDGPSDRGAARRLQNRGPARVEPRVPQQLRAGLAGNREFHGQVVRPRMFDLEPDPGPLDDPVDGRRLNLDRGSAGRWNRHRRRSRGDRHRVNPRLLVQVAQTVGVRIPPVRVEHEVVEVERIRGALKARGAQEADRDADELRRLPVGGREIRRGVPGEIRPHPEAARRRQDHVRLGRTAQGEFSTRLVRRDIADAVEVAEILVQQVEGDPRRVGVPVRCGGILEVIVQDGNAQFGHRGPLGWKDRVSVCGPEVEDRVA